jgi:hypothetical protein
MAIASSPSAKAAIGLWLLTFAAGIGVAQDPAAANPYKEIATKLQSLTRLPLTGCRWHSDVAHPENANLDDSDWKPIEVGANFENGVQVVRCVFAVPPAVNGYNIKAASLRAAFEVQGDGMTMQRVSRKFRCVGTDLADDECAARSAVCHCDPPGGWR